LNRSMEPFRETPLGRPSPRVSLVIPVRNEEGSIGALIDSLRRQTRPPDEVVLVDGGSIDSTVILARTLTAGDPRYRVLEAGDATPGRGRNVGIVAAQHDWIALTDAGIELEPTWLERLVEAVERDPCVKAVYGNCEPVTNSFFTRCAALAYVPAKQPRPDGWMRGPFIASSLVHRDVWQVVGGFPDLRASEDLIFMERIRDRGFKLGWAPTATVHWHIRPTLAQTFRRFVQYSKHNVWAGRQRYWHYGVARIYFAALPFVVLAAVSSPWWLGVLASGAMARVAKSLWTKREGRGLAWLLNPVQFVAVGAILIAIDAATFAGWVLAATTRPQDASVLETAGQTECRRSTDGVFRLLLGRSFRTVAVEHHSLKESSKPDAAPAGCESPRIKLSDRDGVE